MINETKVTLIILPMALVLTFLAAARRGERLKQMVFALGALAVFMALFVPIYDRLIEQREFGEDYTLDKFFSEHVDSYLDTRSDIGTTKTAGRVDSVRVALRETLGEPVRATLGLGIGNTTRSSLGPQFTGRYFERYKMFTSVGFASLILELGFLGFGLLMAAYWLIFRDAWFVAEHGTSYKSALAAAWVGVTPYMLLALFYTSIQISIPLSFLFWYFSGLVAAERARIAFAPVTNVERVAAKHDAIPAGRKAHA
jgi:hypothetical protein